MHVNVTIFDIFSNSVTLKDLLLLIPLFLYNTYSLETKDIRERKDRHVIHDDLITDISLDYSHSKTKHL